MYDAWKPWHEINAPTISFRRKTHPSANAELIQSSTRCLVNAYLAVTNDDTGTASTRVTDRALIAWRYPCNIFCGEIIVGIAAQGEQTASRKRTGTVAWETG